MTKNNCDYKLCPMFGDRCRHCSHEYSTHAFTKVEKDTATKLFRPVGIGSARRLIGEYCNNGCDWVSNLTFCPARWALHR